MSKADHAKTTTQNNLHFLCSAVYFAKGEKQHNQGEDARLVKDNCIGVFDGVGSAPNSGSYARQLSREIRKYIEQPETKNESIYSHVSKALSNNKKKGSCTVCCAKLVGNNLFIAHIGDSGLLKISSGRPHRLVSTSPQQLRFNCPEQVSYCDREHYKSLLTEGPRNRHRIKWEVQDGDILVMGSDGLWDNLSVGEVTRIVQKHMPHNRQDEAQTYGSVSHKYVLERRLMQSSEGFIPGNKGELSMIIAKEIAMKACKVSTSTGRPTPFSKERLKYCKTKNKDFHEKDFKHQGKQDDITVIVAIPTVSNEEYCQFVRLSIAECN